MNKHILTIINKTIQSHQLYVKTTKLNNKRIVRCGHVCLENVCVPIHYICHITFQPSVTRTLLNQEFPEVKLKSSLGKFYDRLYDIVNHYGISMSKITTVSSVFRNHKTILSPFMPYHPICNKSNTTGTVSGTGTDYPSGSLEFTLVFSWVRAAQSLVSCVFCVQI